MNNQHDITEQYQSMQRGNYGPQQPFQVPTLTVPMCTTEIGADFVEQIKRDGVEEYKAKQNRHPVYSGCQLMVDMRNCCTVLQTVVRNETRDSTEFCSGVFKSVTFCMYEKCFPFENIYLVEILLPGDKVPTEIIIPGKYWGKKEMLRILNKKGVTFFLNQNDGQILRILMNHLASFLKGQSEGDIEPRAGWYQKNCQGLSCSVLMQAGFTRSFHAGSSGL